MRKTASIPAVLQISPDALAAINGAGTSPEVSQVLNQVVKLLEDVRSRLDANDSILVDQKTAAKLMSCSAQSLKNWSVPAVKCAGRLMYRRAALEAWAADREAGEVAGAAR
jgi:hypothetical protein